MEIGRAIAFGHFSMCAQGAILCIYRTVCPSEHEQKPYFPFRIVHILKAYNLLAIQLKNRLLTSPFSFISCTNISDLWMNHKGHQLNGIGPVYNQRIVLPIKSTRRDGCSNSIEETRRFPIIL